MLHDLFKSVTYVVSAICMYYFPKSYYYFRMKADLFALLLPCIFQLWACPSLEIIPKFKADFHLQKIQAKTMNFEFQ